jgi:uncharacterized protein (TIGR02147 family)
MFSELGTRAIEAFTPSERYISSMSIGISQDSYLKLVLEIEEFKDRVRRIVNDDKKADQVYTVNLHLFPVKGKQKD